MLKKLLLTTALSSGLTIGATSAANAQEAETNPYAYPDQARVVLTGVVAAESGDIVVLDYGDGSITVELDDQDAFNEAELVEPGDRITVNGLIDRDFREIPSIEADTLFIHESGTLYTDMSYADEEDLYADEGPYAAYDDYSVRTLAYAYPATPADGAQLSVMGTVTDIEGNDFVLDTGVWYLQVETAEMEASPVGLTHDIEMRTGERFVIEEGDTVRVTGEFDASTMENSELRAQSIVRVYDASKKQAEMTGDAS